MTIKTADLKHAVIDSAALANDKEQAVTLAFAVLRDRIANLPQCEKDDLFALMPALLGSDGEERISAARAVSEILHQRPARMVRTDLTSPVGHSLDSWLGHVSAAIRDARKEAGMTQKQLADKSGLPQSHISRLENGEHSPSALTLSKLATAIGCPVWKLDPSAQ